MTKRKFEGSLLTQKQYRLLVWVIDEAEAWGAPNPGSRLNFRDNIKACREAIRPLSPWAHAARVKSFHTRMYKPDRNT